MILRCPSFQYKRPAGLSIASPLGQTKLSDIKVNLKQEIIIGKVVLEPVHTDSVQPGPKISNKMVYFPVYKPEGVKYCFPPPYTLKLQTSFSFQEATNWHLTLKHVDW